MLVSWRFATVTNTTSSANSHHYQHNPHRQHCYFLMPITVARNVQSSACQLERPRALFARSNSCSVRYPALRHSTNFATPSTVCTVYGNSHTKQHNLRTRARPFVIRLHPTVHPNVLNCISTCDSCGNSHKPYKPFTNRSTNHANRVGKSTNRTNRSH